MDSDTSDSEPEISQPYPDNIQPDPDDYGGPLINSNSKGWGGGRASTSILGCFFLGGGG